MRPSADATLLEVNPNNSAGGDVFLLAGTTQNFTRNRALLKFDVASVLPPGAQVLGANLQVDVTRRPRDGFEVALFGLHRVLRDWGEGTTIVLDNAGGLGAPAAAGDATWLDRFAFSQPWAEPGGAADIDYLASPSSVAFLYDVGTYEFESTRDMARDVQYWLDNPGTNFGWMLRIDSEELNFTARRFASREAEEGPPVLTIEYIVVPEPGLCAFLIIFLAGLTIQCARCRAKR